MKIHIFQGPQASGKSTAVNKFTKGKKVKYIENFHSKDVKSFLDNTTKEDIDYIIVLLSKPLEKQIINLKHITQNDKVTFRKPYQEFPKTYEMPDIIIESQFPIDTSILKKLQLDYSIEMAFNSWTQQVGELPEEHNLKIVKVFKILEVIEVKIQDTYGDFRSVLMYKEMEGTYASKEDVESKIKQFILIDDKSVYTTKKVYLNPKYSKDEYLFR